MLKSCKYCGRVHDSSIECESAAKFKKMLAEKSRGTIPKKLRGTYSWTQKSVHIRERDGNLCLCCKANLIGTDRTLNSQGLSVHHIVPLEEDKGGLLDDGNLITVCSAHHELCEDGTISRDTQRQLVQASIRDYNASSPICF